VTMAKTKARPTKSASKKKQALVARVPKSIVRLDEAALKWRKLLEDPCGADLAPPCYAGTGTGYLVRYRTLVNLPPTAVDFLWEFVPSEGPSTCLHNTWSATAGGSLGTAGTSSIGGILDNRLIVGRARCVAACVKVVYLGTELNRSGTVGFTCDSGASLLGGEAVIGNATEWMAGMPHTERIGSREAEYRWVPGLNSPQGGHAERVPTPRKRDRKRQSPPRTTGSRKAEGSEGESDRTTPKGRARKDRRPRSWRTGS
jgi:hypothetical protein